MKLEPKKPTHEEYIKALETIQNYVYWLTLVDEDKSKYVLTLASPRLTKILRQMGVTETTTIEEACKIKTGDMLKYRTCGKGTIEEFAKIINNHFE